MDLRAVSAGSRILITLLYKIRKLQQEYSQRITGYLHIIVDLLIGTLRQLCRKKLVQRSFDETVFPDLFIISTESLRRPGDHQHPSKRASLRRDEFFMQVFQLPVFFFLPVLITEIENEQIFFSFLQLRKQCIEHFKG